MKLLLLVRIHARYQEFSFDPLHQVVDSGKDTVAILIFSYRPSTLTCVVTCEPCHDAQHLDYAGQATILSPRRLTSNAADNLVLLGRLERGAINQLPGLC